MIDRLIICYVVHSLLNFQQSIINFNYFSTYQIIKISIKNRVNTITFNQKNVVASVTRNLVELPCNAMEDIMDLHHRRDVAVADQEVEMLYATVKIVNNHVEPCLLLRPTEAVLSGKQKARILAIFHCRILLSMSFFMWNM